MVMTWQTELQWNYRTSVHHIKDIDEGNKGFNKPNNILKNVKIYSRY